MIHIQPVLHLPHYMQYAFDFPTKQKKQIVTFYGLKLFSSPARYELRFFFALEEKKYWKIPKLFLHKNT